MSMKLGVIIPAAGASSRYGQALEAETGGGGRSKLDEDLGGRPVLHRTVELFTNRDEVASIVVAGPHDEEAMEAFRTRHGDKLSILGVTLCRGGKTHRYETVAAALEHVPQDCTHIAVHDAARPCTPPELIDRVLDAAGRHAAVIPAMDVADTLKRIDPEAVDEAEADPLDAILGDAGRPSRSLRRVSETVDRAELVTVQTPQVFEAGLLRRAYAQENLAGTDDAQLVERLGEEVVVVEGDGRNIKITRPVDLRLARAILGVSGPKERPTHKRF